MRFVLAAVSAALFLQVANAQLQLCGGSPYNVTLAYGGDDGLEYDIAGTSFNLTCFASAVDASTVVAVDVQAIVGCYTNSQQFILAKDIPSTISSPMQFTCPIPATFFVTLFNRNKNSVSVSWNIDGTVDGVHAKRIFQTKGKGV